MFKKRPPSPQDRAGGDSSRESTGEPSFEAARTPPIKPFVRAADSQGLRPAPVRAPRAIAAQSAAPPSAESQPSSPRRGVPARSASAEANVHGLGHLMLVGRDIRLSGRVRACDRLVVEGTLEGETAETHLLEVAPCGLFRGTAVVENCIVAGTFEGDLTVHGVLTLRATGRVTGTVRYGEIEIERGGVISGGFDSAHPREAAARPRPA